MRSLIVETSYALQMRLYMPALISLFAIPDAAATVEYPGEMPRKRYPAWFDAFIGARNPGIDGGQAWLARNALIHETAIAWRSAGYAIDRLIIVLPETGMEVHNVWMNTSLGMTQVLMLEELAAAIIKGASDWLDQAESDPEKSERIQGMMQLRPQGYQKVLNGMPIIT